MTERIQNIDDMLMYYQNTELGGAAADHLGIGKADDPLLTSVSGAYNAHYGGNVFLNINTERNLLGVLPKTLWGPENAWRIISAFDGTKVYGVAENATLPDTGRVTIKTATTLPKQLITLFDASTLQQMQAERGQGFKWEDAREVMGQQHKIGLSEMIGAHATDYGGSTNNLLPLDSIVMSYAEYGATTGLDAAAYAAADFNVYGITRSGGANLWADATVDYNASGGAIVNRPLTLTLINQLEQSVGENSGIYQSKAQVWVTGYDTYRKWGELVQTQQRFSGVEFTSDNVNGISTINGRDAGFRLKSYNEKPIIVSQHVPTPSAGLSPIYLLNLDFLQLWCNLPTVYTEVGQRSGGAQYLGRLGDEGMYLTIAELVCTFFKAQGKLRDLT